MFVQSLGDRSVGGVQAQRGLAQFVGVKRPRSENGVMGQFEDDRRAAEEWFRTDNTSVGRHIGWNICTAAGTHCFYILDEVNLKNRHEWSSSHVRLKSDWIWSVVEKFFLFLESSPTRFCFHLCCVWLVRRIVQKIPRRFFSWNLSWGVKYFNLFDNARFFYIFTDFSENNLKF